MSARPTRIAQFQGDDKSPSTNRRVSPLQADAPGGGLIRPCEAPATPSNHGARTIPSGVLERDPCSGGGESNASPATPCAATSADPNGRVRNAEADRIPTGAASHIDPVKPRKPVSPPWSKEEEAVLKAAFNKVGFGSRATLRLALRGALSDRTDEAISAKLGSLGYRDPRRRQKPTDCDTPIGGPPAPGEPGSPSWGARDAEFVRAVIREGRRLGLC